MTNPESSPAREAILLAASAKYYVHGWDQSQARTWDGICRHTALSALAQLRAAAIRGTLTGSIVLPAADHGDDHPCTATVVSGSVRLAEGVIRRPAWPDEP